MRKRLHLTVAAFLLAMSAFAQADRFWSPNSNSTGIVKNKAVLRPGFPAAFRLFNLNGPAFRQQLLSITGAAASSSTAIISIPNADGNLEQFEVVEASNFEPALQARFPDIRAYSGKGITDRYATLKLSFSPEGVQTMVFRSDRENEFIEPYASDGTVYAVYRAHRSKGGLPWTCSTDDRQLTTDINGRASAALATGASTGQLRTLRLALSCNGEYANYFGASSSANVNLVLAAFNATLTRCNGVFEKDLALHLNLIDRTREVIYYNPSTDPYTTLSSWNLQLQQTLTSVIGSGAYDIGHMFGASGGGGNAGCIGCVCVDPVSKSSKAKGSGITSPADGHPTGDNFDIDYVAHEMGHQLGANHTFSMSLEGTGQNKEVGSGITIMGYAGITSQDVAPHSIDIFHATSIAQIQANLANKACTMPANITASNVAPVIAPVSNYTIPVSTPFALTASASDANGDALTYCWEQNDNSTTSGTASVASPTKTTGPNWLSFTPAASPTRVFPMLSTILNGLAVTPPLAGGDAGANIEALSAVARTLNFRLTVRDNHIFNPAKPEVGQTAFTDVVVTVANTGGPFAVTAPNTNVTWTAGQTATVTWSVNGTNASPINCTSVNILLSTDGGQTFNLLKENTPNDGSETVSVPNTTGTTNRIKVEAVGNIFFDISNTNFTISGTAASCGDPSGLTATNITATAAVLGWTTVSGATSYTVQYKTATAQNWTAVSPNVTTNSYNLTGLSSGTDYLWQVKATCTSGAGNFVQGQFTTTAPAPCGNPAGLTATDVTTTSATLNWTAVNGADSYTVQYRQSGNSGWTTAASGIQATAINLTGLTANTTYDWQVGATCGSVSGNFVPSAFTTPAAPVTTCPAFYDTETNGTINGAEAIPFNTNIYGLINARGDEDYYTFGITTSGTITVSLTSLPADYQLGLYKGTTLVQSSTRTGTSDESISITADPGTYYVRVYPKNNGAFNATNCYTLLVQTGTAARVSPELVTTGEGVNVSPNPARGTAKLSFTAPEAGQATVSVMSQTGAVVLQKSIAVTAGRNTRDLELGHLATGLYLVKVQTGTVVQTTRLVMAR